MKNFINEVFKPYLFPIILLLAGAYFKTAESLSPITHFFAKSSNSILHTLNHQFYLWEVILYLCLAFITIRLFRFFKNQHTKREKIMLKAIKKTKNEMLVTINGTPDKYLFKFKTAVINEEYEISDLRPYCQNCSNISLRMTDHGYGDFRCNCGKKIDYKLCKDVESRILTEIERNEI